MWSHEHAAETALPPERIWAVLSDIDSWAEWDTSLETIELHGPFQVGTAISMTPVGQDPIRATIVDIVENERYADETVFGGATLNFSHSLTRLTDGGTRIVHRLDIAGQVPAELGPAITEDFPDAMQGLLARAATA
jgi:hypothetical protein